MEVGISDLIQTVQPLETGAMSKYPYSAKLERKFKFESRYGELVELAVRDGDYLWLPRAVCPVGKLDKRVRDKQALFPSCPTPREHQEELFAHVEQMVAEDQHEGTFVAPTGWGKLILGFKIAHTVGQRTLAVTTKEDIYEQWLDGAEKFLGLKKSEIGEIRQDKCEIEGRKFCVSLVQSLRLEDKYPKWIRDEFGLVIFDENHRMSATQFQTVVRMFPAYWRYGLSATPDRPDGKNLVFQSNIGPVLAKEPEKGMIPKVMRVRTEWRCPRTFAFDKKTKQKKVVRIPHVAGKTSHVDKILSVDDERNALIAKFTKIAWKKGRDIVVFSTSLLHLEQLERALHKAGIPKTDIGWYTSESTKSGKARREADKDKKIKLATYGMMSEGTNITQLDTAVIAMPRADVTQPVGRIRREHDTKRFPLVLDFLDYDSPVYRSYANRRLEWYKSLGAVVEDIQ